MKAVNTVDLIQTTTKPKDTRSTAKISPSKTDLMVRKTYSIETRHNNQINAMAACLSTKVGKPVGSSEALRYLLDQVDGKIKQ